MPEKKSHTKAKRLNPIPWIAGALLVLGLAVLGGLYWNRTGTVENVRFEGNRVVTLKQLQQRVHIPKGIHPDSVNFDAIRSDIEKIDYVKQADIAVEPGGTVIITVHERTPVALLVKGSNRSYVDSEGIRLPMQNGQKNDLPILYGFNTKPMDDTLTSENFKRASSFLQALQQRPASDATISEVAWNNDEGIITLTNENGVRLIFGKDEFNNRLRNWEAFYANVVRRKGINKMKSVDLRFKGQIVTREK